MFKCAKFVLNFNSSTKILCCFSTKSVTDASFTVMRSSITTLSGNNGIHGVSSVVSTDPNHSRTFTSCTSEKFTNAKQREGANKATFLNKMFNYSIRKTSGTSSSQTTPNGVGDDQVIYIGTLTRMVRFVKLFSLSTSAVGISLQPYIYQNVADLPLLVAAAVTGVTSFFIFLTPVLLHIVTKRYVIEMSLNEQTGKYTATTYSLFLRLKKLQFTSDQVSIPNMPGIFTTIRVNKIPLFVDPNLFTDRRYFIKLMGYDEPMEWELNPEEKDKTDHQLPPKSK